MPAAVSVGSSRRKLGQPTVCLECYLRKVKCDRKRPCNTCTRRGTEQLCKTFDTSELDAETLQKKQARRSMSEINAFLDATQAQEAQDEGHNPDPQQPRPEHPMTTFLTHMIKDLNTSDASESLSPASVSTEPAMSNAPPYTDLQTVKIMVAFCAILPEWNQLATLIRHYIWHVDWKFLITSQDLLESSMRQLWLRVILPCRSPGKPDGSVNQSLFQHGDLSRLALLATIVGEMIETMDPDSIADLFPASRTGTAMSTPVKIEAEASPRVRALLLITHHIPILITKCVELDEMTIDLVQANVAAFSLWTSQGLHSFGDASDFPQWDITMRAAKGCNLFEEPAANSPVAKNRSQLDHHRRLAWLVYGYDHAFAVGANTKPLIVDAQFSVDGPSDAPPWAASGSPPDPCLAMLEVQAAKIAQMVSNTLCYGIPLHRKVMETDQLILEVMSRLHPSYVYDNPDTSLDSKDPFRARRRCWLQLTTAWQRGSLHRHCFFPNGRINNGELATSRHIATDSAIRSITGARELRRLQNRFSDYQASAWYYQYLTEPSMTLATGALLLIRSKGRGVPGLSAEQNCWPTVMHFVKTIDESLQEINASIKDTSVCLPSFLSFGQRCSQLIRQLRAAVQSSMDSLIKADPGVQSVIDVQVDESLLSLLHPRARSRRSLAPGTESSSGSGSASASNAGSADGSARRRKRPRVTSSKLSAAVVPPASSSSSSVASTSPNNTLHHHPSVSDTSRSASWAMGNAASSHGSCTQQEREDSFGQVGMWLPMPDPSTSSSEMFPAPHLGVPAIGGMSGHSLSSHEPGALQSFYANDEVQRANEGRGLNDWISSIQMSLMLPQPHPPLADDV